MDIPEVIFINNRETELQRLIHTAKQTWSGFYTDKGYRVSPLSNNLGTDDIYLPRAGFERIQNVDKILQHIKLNFPIKYPMHLASQVRFKYVPISTKHYEMEWQRVEEKFWSITHTLFSEGADRIKSLEIRITRFGSISSFQFLDTNNNSKAIIYLRKDADISHIAEAILLSLINLKPVEYRGRWEENKKFVDFLMKKTNLKSLFPKYESNKTSKNNSDQRYIRELGVKTKTNLDLVGKNIYLNNKLISYNLSANQKLILIFMLNNGHFISHQRISDIIWGDDENKFSLWAINKTMQRLRKKLAELGASEDILITLRRRGYLLNN